MTGDLRRLHTEELHNEMGEQEFFVNNPSAKQEEAAEALGVSRRNVQDTVASLKAQGLIRREGSKKNGVWLVKDSEME